MDPATVSTIYAIVQGLIASVGIIINIYFMYIGAKSKTKMKQLYTLFMCCYSALMILHCITILASFPQFFFDTNKESIIYSYFTFRYSKLMLVVFLLISEVQFVYFLWFFAVRHQSFQLIPRTNDCVNWIALFLAFSGFILAVLFYYLPFLVHNWDLPFNSTQTHLSLADTAYLRYDITYHNIQSLFAYPMFLSKAILILFYVLIVAFHISIRREIEDYVGSTYSKKIHKNTMCNLFIQVTVTFGFLLPFYIYEVVITIWPEIYSYSTGLFFYTLQPAYVLIVPFFNCGIKEWLDAERIHKTSVAVAPYQSPNTEAVSESRF